LFQTSFQTNSPVIPDSDRESANPRFHEDDKMQVQDDISVGIGTWILVLD